MKSCIETNKYQNLPNQAEKLILKKLISIKIPYVTIEELLVFETEFLISENKIRLKNNSKITFQCL